MILLLIWSLFLVARLAQSHSIQAVLQFDGDQFQNHHGVGGFELDLNELRLVQFQDSEPVWITEQQKLYAKSLGMEYLDVTNLPPNFGTLFEKRRYSYPTPNSTLVASILPLISIEEMRVNLEYFTGAFETRYYNSDSGKASSEWLLKKIQEYTTQLATPQVQRLVTVKPFKHHWKQTSVIVHIQPREPIDDGITVIGAHCDSINQENPFLPAPGADDDGSGTVTILEAYRALLISGYIPTSPLEFHFYSAEEGGGLGSQDIVASYEAARKEIKGMQQYDMTAWVASGTSPVVNVVTSGVDAALSTFLCQLVDRYLDIPCVRESKRKNAGSDHLLWNRAGYQACHAAEGLMGNENYDNIHTAQDRIDVSPEFSFEHINEFAKLAVAFAVELSS